MRKKSLFFFLVCSTFALDWLTKLWIVEHIPTSIETSYPYGGIGVFSHVLGVSFSLVHEINRGAMLGFFAEYQTLLLFFRMAFCLFLILYALQKKRSWGATLSLSFIVGGALGNIVDVFVYGHVIDMFKFVFGSFHYPVFNIADSAITIGAVLYFLTHFEKKYVPST